MSKKTSLIILILVSVGVHFAFFGRPNETVFDEVHFGKFVSAYYTGEYYFDIHPPGGKLLIAGFAKLFHFAPEYSFAEIGQTFPDHKYLALRFLPILAGALLAIIIYFLALKLGLSVIASFAAGMLVTLDNALLTQSRYILLDPFLLSFGFASLLFYFRYRSADQHWKLPALGQAEARPGKMVNWNLLLMGILGGLAFSIKWTGITFLGIAGLIQIFKIIRNFSIKQTADFILYFIILPLAVYLSIFLIHFSLLPKSGEGDAFMTPEFQRTLQGSAYADDAAIQPLNAFEKFIELNEEMYRANATLTATHPYGSKWYTWPLMIRPIYYWNHSSGTIPVHEKIYLIGNPFIWWTSTIAILYLILNSLGEIFLKIRRKSVIINTLPLILMGGWIVNLFPFVGISRVMFIYHYLTAFIFAILALAHLLDSYKSRRLIIAMIVIAAVTFLYFAPLSYGLPLEAGSFDNRIWLPTWQ